MTDYGLTLTVIGLGAFAVVALQFRFARFERPYMWACFFGHVVSSFALVLLTRHYFGGGDMFTYEAMGQWLREQMTDGSRQYVPEVIRLLLQQDSIYADLPFGGGATGSMSAITGLLLLMLGGSFAATNVTISIAAFFGQLAIYSAFRACFAPAFHRRILIATLLIPSVIFWSSGTLKESVALAGLGWMVLGAIRFAHKQLGVAHLMGFVVGTVLVALVKPYILPPFFISAGVAYYWRRAQVSGRSLVPTIKPLHLILAATLAIGGVLVVGELFPQFAIENLADEAARRQEVGQRVDGGSNYEMGNPSERSLAGQLVYAPWALVSALLRPFVFEARNLMSFVNALETTAFLVLAVGAFRLRRSGSVLRVFLSSPTLLFCAAFTVAFGVGVGLGTTNMGTLSRYRMPMVPFYATILLLLQAPPRSAKVTQPPGTAVERDPIAG